MAKPGVCPDCQGKKKHLYGGLCPRCGGSGLRTHCQCGHLVKKCPVKGCKRK